MMNVLQKSPSINTEYHLPCLSDFPTTRPPSTQQLLDDLSKNVCVSVPIAEKKSLDLASRDHRMQSWNRWHQMEN